MPMDEHQLFETALAATMKDFDFFSKRGSEDGARIVPLQVGAFLLFFRPDTLPERPVHKKKLQVQSQVLDYYHMSAKPDSKNEKPAQEEECVLCQHPDCTERRHASKVRAAHQTPVPKNAARSRLLVGFRGSEKGLLGYEVASLATRL
ncbi:hypothetical protein PO909_014284 [Leuciscus waleckii]